MSLINTQVQPFKVNAFHAGEFVEVTDSEGDAAAAAAE